MGVVCGWVMHVVVLIMYCAYILRMVNLLSYIITPHYTFVRSLMAQTCRVNGRVEQHYVNK